MRLALNGPLSRGGWRVPKPSSAPGIARDLAYRPYTLCERKGWAEEAGYYNSLVVAWPSMASPELLQ